MKMISPKGMDELFCGTKLDDVHHDWVGRLEITTKVRGIDEQKLFKISRLNLKRKSNEWFKNIAIVLTN
jgi:hypothetical protein